MGAKTLSFLDFTVVIGIYLLAIGPMLLKDYKDLYLCNGILEFKYSYGLIVKKSFKYELDNIEELKVVKYALQANLPTMVYVTFSANKKIKTKKIAVKIESKQKEFMSLIRQLESKGVRITIEGDFWRKKNI